MRFPPSDGCAFFFFTAEHAETAERTRKQALHALFSFLLHRDFVIQMLRLVASEVRESNFPSSGRQFPEPTERRPLSDHQTIRFLVFLGVLCASTIDFDSYD
ncbi:MAG: hypothetical protein B1H02_07190 [Candidatus Latescibacteria bacterium 4484_107]|nr:MAG: hypothetical protein B1H02_07190 [Candidatus Latescibacteria bacterium 4484_107]